MGFLGKDLGLGDAFQQRLCYEWKGKRGTLANCKVLEFRCFLVEAFVLGK